ncbi:MAG: DUF3040 domain-containing protein [Micromonosporaceae bacterium]
MLTNDERQRLQAIEYGLRRDDPMFAATMQEWRLTEPPAMRWRTARIVGSVVLFVLMMTAVIAGLAG